MGCGLRNAVVDLHAFDLEVCLALGGDVHEARVDRVDDRAVFFERVDTRHDHAGRLLAFTLDEDGAGAVNVGLFALHARFHGVGERVCIECAVCLDALGILDRGRHGIVEGDLGCRCGNLGEGEERCGAGEGSRAAEREGELHGSTRSLGRGEWVSEDNCDRP